MVENKGLVSIGKIWRVFPGRNTSPLYKLDGDLKSFNGLLGFNSALDLLSAPEFVPLCGKKPNTQFISQRLLWCHAGKKQMVLVISSVDVCRDIFVQA